MTHEELIKALRSIDHMNVEDCFLQSHFYSKAADLIEKLVKERDATREAVLREAAENCKTCQCRDEILELIGEKT
jgi:hypothetical protein